MTEAYNFNLTGDCGVWTCLEDMAKWACHLMTDKRLLSIAGPRDLQGGGSNDYSFGFFKRQYRGVDYFIHDGDFGCYKALSLYIPGEDLAYICLMNNEVHDINKLTSKVLEDLLGPHMEKAEGGLAYEDYLGTYLSKEDLRIYRVGFFNDHLYLINLYQSYKVFGDGQGFTSKDLSHTLSKEDGVPVIRTLGKCFTKVKPVSDVKTSHLTGRYLCRDFKAFFDIEDHDGRLRIKSYKALDSDLTPLTSDLLALGNTYLEVVKDQGQVLGLVLRTAASRLKYVL